METVFDFRIRITPRWDVLIPIIKERVQQRGLVWPARIRPLQFAKIYALSLVGQQRIQSNQLSTQFNVLAWAPPKEPPVAEGLTDFSELRLPLSVRQQKVWKDTNAGHTIDFDTLAPVLTGDGLVLVDTHASQNLAGLPYQAILDVMFAVATKKTQLKVTHSDHIVEHLAVPTPLTDFKLSHWRGDASYRLSHASADLEVWATLGA